MNKRFTAVFAAALLLTACGGETSDTEPAVAAAPAHRVSAQRLEPVSWQGWVESFGVVEALTEVDVASELSGTVSAVYVDEGDRVEPGQLLLELDTRKRELALEQAKQQVERTQIALKEAQLKLERRHSLAERETISQELLDNARLAVDAASATHQQALAARNLAERELADTRIISPTTGLVEVQRVEPGEPVQVGASLIKLQALGGVRVQTWVSEQDVLLLSAGDNAEVSVPGLPGESFAGLVEWVGVKADPATGNFQIKLILDSDHPGLRPGMTARTRMQAKAIDDVLILPETALLDRNRRRMVFVVEDGIAHLREPVLSAGLSGRLQILTGLAPGERVITQGHQSLVDGSPVTVTSTTDE